ncbi:MAG TPA: YlxR family protein [Humidesulfovibrio sp.]|uniref:YlxR family protein n=1 Tax=Humidesulfovibrio sp. TaxID=2910988 RepID=UPI002CFD676C|nr:YlxR family protein [Humidesulfovibrio sp.]HWR04745.1 YlxR family protein [Humidesulfovibrio sp.]
MTDNGHPQGAGPVRMCCICRRRLAKAELLRHVRGDGEKGEGIKPDPKGILPGRGLYVCGQAECRERFLRYGDRRKKR